MDEKPDIAEILNRILQIEAYSIWLYPCVVQQIGDAEAAKIFNGFIKASRRHAEKTIDLIKTFGGQPLLDISKPPEKGHFCAVLQEEGVIAILNQMIEHEKLAMWSYTQAAGLTDKAEGKKLLLDGAQEENQHAALVEEILMKLIR